MDLLPNKHLSTDSICFNGEIEMIRYVQCPVIIACCSTASVYCIILDPMYWESETILNEIWIVCFIYSSLCDSFMITLELRTWNLQVTRKPRWGEIIRLCVPSSIDKTNKISHGMLWLYFLTLIDKILTKGRIVIHRLSWLIVKAHNTWNLSRYVHIFFNAAVELHDVRGLN